MSGGRRSGEGAVAGSAGGSRRRRGGRVSVGGAPAAAHCCLPSLIPPRTPGPQAAGEGGSQASSPGVRRPRGSKDRHPTHTRRGWGSRKSNFISDPSDGLITLVFS